MSTDLSAMTPKAQRPIATDNGPSAAGDLVKGSKQKPGASAPVSTLGADALKSMGQGGQTLDKLPLEVVGPIPADASAGLIGGGTGDPGGNVASAGSGFPQGGSRAPTTGSAPGRKNLSKTK